LQAFRTPLRGRTSPSCSTGRPRASAQKLRSCSALFFSPKIAHSARVSKQTWLRNHDIFRYLLDLVRDRVAVILPRVESKPACVKIIEPLSHIPLLGLAGHPFLVGGVPQSSAAFA